VSFPTLPFASCFTYLPGGSGSVCGKGRLLCARLKAADSAWLPRLVSQVWLEAVGHGRFSEVLDGRAVLIPVPGSAPLQRVDWVGERVAWCLTELGLGTEVWPILRRRHAVKKSAFAAAGERPSVLEHYASFAVEPGFLGRALVAERGFGGRGLRLILVDDVITRGRTLLAAARRLHESFPRAEIRAFALLRTLGPDETLRRVLDPCEGEVRWISGDARRRP
jgi:predicted amidophosphoribosyltransferase